MDFGSWVGLTPTQAIGLLKRLTCEGFENSLFCGEVTDDCIINATDALIILKIAVGILTGRLEADVDGSGVTLATDGLLALQIAVGAKPNTDECNVP